VDRSVRIRVAVAIEPPWLLVPGIESRPVDQARIDEEDDRFPDLKQAQPLQAAIPRGVVVRIDDRAEPKADALRLVLTERAHVRGPTRSVANGPDDVRAHGIRQTGRELHGDVGDRHRRRRWWRRLTVIGRPVVAVAGRLFPREERLLRRKTAAQPRLHARRIADRCVGRDERFLIVLRFHLTGLQENSEAKASTESGLQRRSVHAGLDAWHYGWSRVGHV